MLSATSSLYLLLLLALSIPLEKLALRLKLPVSGCLVVLGFLSSEFLVRMGGDTGLRWNNFNFAILYLFLPALVFQSALRIDLRLLRENLVPVLLLAVPLSLIATGIIATVLYYGIGVPSGFPWMAALITGALLAATDPAAVLSLPATVNLSSRLRIILEGESLFNDVTAILLFGILIAIALHPQGESAATSLLYRFPYACGGGMLLGAAMGLGASLLYRMNRGTYSFGTITLVAAYLSFLLAEKIIGVSGVMAVLSCGLMLRRLMINELHEKSWIFGMHLWGFIGRLLENLIFILAGITITLIMFSDRWKAMLLGIGAILIARLIIVSALLAPLCRLFRLPALSVRHQALLHWGGARGTITLALALALPLQLDYWYTTQAIAYGVVLFTLFVQTTSIGWVARGNAPRESGQ